MSRNAQLAWLHLKCAAISQRITTCSGSTTLGLGISSHGSCSARSFDGKVNCARNLERIGDSEALLALSSDNYRAEVEGALLRKEHR